MIYHIYERRIYMEKIKKMLNKGEDIMTLFFWSFVVLYLLKVYEYNGLILSEPLLYVFICFAVMMLTKNKEIDEYARKSLLIVSVIMFVLILVNALEYIGLVSGISVFLSDYSYIIANLVVYAYVVISIPFDKKKKVNKDEKVYKYLSIFVVGAYFLYFMFFLSDRNFGTSLFGLIMLAIELWCNLLLMRFAYKK